jgi:hypothetical protein
MIQQLSVALRASIAAGRFPLVYGADCSVLMAALPRFRIRLANRVSCSSEREVPSISCRPAGQSFGAHVS